MELLVRRSLLLLAFVSATTTCAFSFAGLAFEKTRIEMKAEIGASEIDVEYPFQVTGDQPLTIDTVDTGCGCADYDTENTQYRPGDKGKVKIKVRIGDREGLYQTPMLVHWRQGEQKAAESLFIQIEIPVIARFSQRVLVFAAGDREKTVTIDVPKDSGVKLRLGEAVGGHRMSLKQSKDGSYTLSVAPGDELRNGFVEVLAESGKTLVKKWRIFLRVRQ